MPFLQCVVNLQGWTMLGTFFYLAFAAEAMMFIFMLLDRGQIFPDDQAPPEPSESKTGDPSPSSDVGLH
jgi:hypothetical protein